MSVLTRTGLADRLGELLQVAEEEADRSLGTVQISGLGGPARYAAMQAWCDGYEADIEGFLTVLRHEGNEIGWAFCPGELSHFEAHGMCRSSDKGLPDAIVEWIGAARTADRRRA